MNADAPNPAPSGEIKTAVKYPMDPQVPPWAGGQYVGQEASEEPRNNGPPVALPVRDHPQMQGL